MCWVFPFKFETQMIQSNILDMYRVFPFKLETYMKKSFKIFSPRFFCPCRKPLLPSASPSATQNKHFKPVLVCCRFLLKTNKKL